VKKRSGKLMTARNLRSARGESCSSGTGSEERNRQADDGKKYAARREAKAVQAEPDVKKRTGKLMTARNMPLAAGRKLFKRIRCEEA